MKHRVRENSREKANTESNERKEKRAKIKVFSLENVRVFLSLCYLFCRELKRNQWKPSRPNYYTPNSFGRDK